MFERFIDKDYDGVVIKIPNFAIPLNKLEEVLKNLQIALDESKFCMHHPDMVNSIYELENYKEKVKIIREREELEKIAAERRKKDSEEFYRKRIDREILDIEWKSRVTDYMEIWSSDFEFDGVSYKSSEVVTKSNNVGSKLKKHFIEVVSKLTKDTIQDLLMNNYFGITKSWTSGFEYLKHWTFSDNPLGTDKMGNLTIRID